MSLEEKAARAKRTSPAELEKLALAALADKELPEMDKDAVVQLWVESLPLYSQLEGRSWKQFFGDAQF